MVGLVRNERYLQYWNNLNDKAKGGLHNRLLYCVDLDVRRLSQILKNFQKTIDKLTKMWYNIYVIKRKEIT